MWYSFRVTNPPFETSFKSKITSAVLWGAFFSVPIAVYSSFQMNMVEAKHKAQLAEIRALDRACEQEVVDKQKALKLEFVTATGVHKVVCDDTANSNGCTLESKPFIKKSQF